MQLSKEIKRTIERYNCNLELQNLSRGFLGSIWGSATSLCMDYKYCIKTSYYIIRTLRQL